MAYPISTSLHLTFDGNYEIPVAEQVKQITRNGFEHVDFNFLDWYSDARSPFVGNNWREWAISAGEAAAETGADFNQAHAPCPCLACAHDADLLHEYIRRAIISCADLKIPWMVYHLIPDPKAFGSNQDVFQYNREFFAPVQELSHKYGVGIALENVWPVLDELPYRDTDVLVQFVDSFNDPLVGMCWDTGHGNMTFNSHNFRRFDHTELLACRDQYKNIMKLGKRLKCLHVNDNGGMDDDHIVPFFGQIHWPDVIRALDDVGYEHSFTFECHMSFSHLIGAGIRGRSLDLNIQLLHSIGEDLVAMSRFQ